jgi:GNAT superfamily N-acetyltransferase
MIGARAPRTPNAITLDRMDIEGPLTGVSSAAEQILRSLPAWFGIEASLLEYVRATERFPTFVARSPQRIVAFLTVKEHFVQSWEVHCLAVDAPSRHQGIGRALHAHVERWLSRRGVRFLQVKTIAPSSSSPEYAETRAFYDALGYTPLEVFPSLWRAEHPALLLVKAL